MIQYRKLAMGVLLATAALTVAAGPVAPVLAANPPQIEYVLVLDSHGKPRTSFHPGAKLGFRIELYFVGKNAGGVETAVRVTTDNHTMFHRTLHGDFRGPTRGNLFTQTQLVTLSPHTHPGTYTVSVALTVDGRHLSRSARFYVR